MADQEIEDLNYLILGAFDKHLDEWVHEFVKVVSENRGSAFPGECSVGLKYEIDTEDGEGVWVEFILRDSRHTIKLAWPTKHPELTKQNIEIILKRTQQGCPNCGKPWSKKDLESNLPSIGMACSECHSVTQVTEEEIKDGDWYYDDNGIIWEYRFAGRDNVYRWFQIDPQICGTPEGREIEQPKK